MQMTTLARCTLFVVLVLASGCTWSITKPDVIGEWHLSNDSRRHFANGLSGVTPKLTFHADGRFEADDLPSEMVGRGTLGKEAVGTVDATGTWRLDKGVDPRVQLSFRSVDGQSVDYGQNLELPHLRRPVVLVYFRSVDDAILIEFEKKY